VRQPWRRERTLALHLDGELPLAAVGRRAGLREAISGTARVVADVAGAPDAPRVEGQITIPELGVAGAAVRDVAIAARWADGQLAATDLEAHLGSGRLKGRVTATLLRPAGAEVRLELSELALPDPLDGLGVGTATAHARIAGAAVEIARAEAA